MRVGLQSQCPHCANAVFADESEVGKRVSCPSCDQSFVLASVRVVSAALRDTGEIAAPTRDGPPAKAAGAPLPEGKPAKNRLGRFEVKELLGQGGFGRVYRAYDPQLDRFVALKVPTFGPQDKSRVQRFLTEAKAAARLRHPHIVPTYESGHIDGRYYIAAQFVSGTTLAKRLQDGRTDVAKRPTFEESARWVRDLASALARESSTGISSPTTSCWTRRGSHRLWTSGWPRG